MRNGRGNNWTGQYPGRGPYSNLPPEQRPGWLYGRGACRYMYGPYSITQIAKPEDETTLLNEQKKLIEEQLSAMQETLKKVQERLEELKGNNTQNT